MFFLNCASLSKVLLELKATGSTFTLKLNNVLIYNSAKYCPFKGTVALFTNEVRFFRFRVFLGACSLENEVGNLPFFFFLAILDHYLSEWQV